MRLKTLRLIPSAAALLLANTAFAAPEVVVSIKPIHALVSAVMQGVGEPELIVQGAASPHTYSMKPSNARALQNAKVVFWVGENLEAFLEKPLQSLTGGATVVSLAEAPGVKLLPLREGGTFEPHDDGDHDEAEAHHDHAAEAHDHHEGDHEHGHFDMHLWLDPQNAKAMVDQIETTLAKADPQNAATYETNAKALNDRIDTLNAELAKQLEPVKAKPMVVFHDAYQYFEQRYGLSVVGSITVSPETAPGAERLSEIHGKLAALKASCVFAEPQFQPRLLEVVTAGTTAKSGTLDPEGATLKEGPDLYFELMRNLSKSVTDCLGH